jgi:DnaJ-class molecular chaperone
MRFTGMGYESKDPKGLNGDLIIQIIYNIDSNKYVIKGNTIYEKISIPYYDCILGCTKKVKLPNNKEKEITIKPLTNHGDNVILNGEGINGGQYIYVVEPELPKRTLSSKLSNEEKELLEKIKKLHK